MPESMMMTICIPLISLYIVLLVIDGAQMMYKFFKWIGNRNEK